MDQVGDRRPFGWLSRHSDAIRQLQLSHGIGYVDPPWPVDESGHWELFRDAQIYPTELAVAIAVAYGSPLPVGAALYRNSKTGDRKWLSIEPIVDASKRRH